MPNNNKSLKTTIKGTLNISCIQQRKLISERSVILYDWFLRSGKELKARLNNVVTDFHPWTTVTATDSASDAKVQGSAHKSKRNICRCSCVVMCHNWSGERSISYACTIGCSYIDYFGETIKARWRLCEELSVILYVFNAAKIILDSVLRQ